MTQVLTTPHVSIDRIEVIDGYNARTHFDPAKEAEMAANLAEVGMIEPLPVFVREDGRCELLAGERRFRAAQKAGLEEVPIAPQATRDRRIAFAENHHREDFDPIATARDLKALAEERELGTVKEIAAAAGKKPEWVGLHLRLLKLPEAVQEAIAAGRVSVKAERELRQVAKVSPAVAEWLCEWADRHGVSATQFAEDFHDVLVAAGRSREEGKPTMVSVNGFGLGEVLTDPDRHQELAERYRAASPYLSEADPIIRPDSSDIDAARAARCLIEHTGKGGGFTSTARFITDTALAVDLAERVIERAEKAAAERKAAAPAPAGDDGSGPAAAKPSESPQAKAKRLKAKAVAFNEVLWGKVLKARTPGRRKQASLQRAKAATLVMIASNPELAGAGLRLVWPQLREVEEKQLKNGKTRTTVAYADREQCTAELLRKVMGAKSLEDLAEVSAEAIATAILAKPEAVAQADRLRWSVPYSVQKDVKKLLAGDLKALRARTAK